MFLFDVSWFIDSVFIFTIAVLIDLIVGEYPDRIHPTIGIGKLISFFKKKAKKQKPTYRKNQRRFNGASYHDNCRTFPSDVLLVGLRYYFGSIPYIIAGAILFKATFAISGMGQYTKPIAAALKKNDLAGARKWLPYIVRRDPNTLKRTTNRLCSSGIHR